MVQASVGFHCPDCVASYRKAVPQARLRSEQRPYATLGLIALNVVVFAAGALSDSSSVMSDGNPFAPDAGLFGPLVATGEWWRIVTSGFLHAGIFHLGMNMLALWLLGSQLEVAIGRIRYLGLYFASLFAGALGVLLVDPTSLTVGASGAVFGLMGAAFALQKRRGIDPWASGVGGLIVVNLLFTFFYPGISIGGHLGGLLGGMACGYALFQMEDRTSSVWPSIGVCAGISVACIGLSLMVAGADDGLLSFLNLGG